MAPRSAMLALLMVLASGLEEEVWGPTDGVKAFDAIEKALTKVVATGSRMSLEQSKKAKNVADDVRKAIAVVESKSNLTKAQKKATMGSAVKELMDLEVDFKKENEAMLSGKLGNEKLDKLRAELAEKKHELVQDEAQIKLATLQKELLEKKMQLQKLIEKKQQSEASKSAQAVDAKAEAALVDKLMNLSGSLAQVSGNKSELSAPLKAALTEVQARDKKEAASLASMDASNKKMMATLDAQVKATLPLMGKDDILGKGQSMIRRLKKQEHRQYLKARAHKVSQLSELKSIEKSIEQHDAKSLDKTLVRMRSETKAMTAQSGDFLH